MAGRVQEPSPNPHPNPNPDQGRVNELKQERLFNITYLQQQHGITPHHVDVLHRRATLPFSAPPHKSD